MVDEIRVSQNNGCTEAAWTAPEVLFPGGEPDIEITKSGESTITAMKWEQQKAKAATLDLDSRFSVTVPDKCPKKSILRPYCETIV